MRRTEPGMDHAAIMGKRIVRLITTVIMPVQIEAAQTHEIVIYGDKLTFFAARRIRVIVPAYEMISAIRTSFQAESVASCHSFLRRLIKTDPPVILRCRTQVWTDSQ